MTHCPVCGQSLTSGPHRCPGLAGSGTRASSPARGQNDSSVLRKTDESSENLDGSGLSGYGMVDFGGADEEAPSARADGPHAEAPVEAFGLVDLGEPEPRGPEPPARPASEVSRRSGSVAEGTRRSQPAPAASLSGRSSPAASSKRPGHAPIEKDSRFGPNLDEEERLELAVDLKTARRSPAEVEAEAARARAQHLSYRHLARRELRPYDDPEMEGGGVLLLLGLLLVLGSALVLWREPELRLRLGIKGLAPEEVFVQVNAAPTPDEVFLDGQLQKSMSFKLLRSSRVHSLRLQARGHRGELLHFVAEGETTVTAVLSPRKP